MSPPSDSPGQSPSSQRPPSRRVLVVDDEEGLRHVLQVILSRAGYEVLTAGDGEAALAALVANEDVSLVLCDVRMPRLDGLGFLKRLRDAPPVDRPIHTIMMSAYGAMDLALEAMKQGAQDYISKPFKGDEILLTLKKVEERERLVLENERLRAAMRARGGFEGFIGRSLAITSLLDTARKVAAYPSTVLITGESGTGKELLAKGLHALSDRSERPFVAINCGAIPENLLESELFGHARGAFTGAVRERLGLFEQADSGTLLLDELGELPQGLQVKLLRALEESTVRRVGSNREVPVDVRLLAATSRDLSAEVAAGRFRADLFYRLNVVHLRIPALRDRSADIPLLVGHFIQALSQRLDKRVRAVAPEAMRALVDAPWPGNVRQLENALERGVLLCDGDTLRLGDLPPGVGQAGGPEAPAGEASLSIKLRTAQLERELIARALTRTEGNRSQAARLLEISYKALLYKIRDYGLE